METKQIQQLMLLMGKHSIKKLRWKDDKGEIELEKEDSRPHLPCPHHFFDSENPMRHDFERHRTESEKHKLSHSAPEAVKKEEVDTKSVFVSSPMVGTAYRAASPGDKPFVQVGDTVHENTVVCIIEAMKVMNEVKAGCRGVVKEIFIENGHPVDFGAKLFKILPV